MNLVIDRRPVHDTLVDDVRHGLTRPLKELPPKLFYDERGSVLFDRITSLPEYYPTRCERSILNRHAPEIVERNGAEELVELLAAGLRLDDFFTDGAGLFGLAFASTRP